MPRDRLSHSRLVSLFLSLSIEGLSPLIHDISHSICAEITSSARTYFSGCLEQAEKKTEVRTAEQLEMSLRITTHDGKEMVMQQTEEVSVRSLCCIFRFETRKRERERVQCVAENHTTLQCCGHHSLVVKNNNNSKKKTKRKKLADRTGS